MEDDYTKFEDLVIETSDEVWWQHYRRIKYVNGMVKNLQ